MPPRPITSDGPSLDSWESSTSTATMECEDWELERYQDSEPAIVPSVLFTEEQAAKVDWEAVFAAW